MTNNPLLNPSTLPNQAPAFDQFKTEHYLPAIEASIAEARTNIDAIKNNTDAPTFENTIVAMESASEAYGQVAGIFYNALSSMGGDALHELAEQIAPIGAKFASDIMLDETLFAKTKTIFEQGFETLTTEQTTLLKDTYKDFIRAGAALDEDKKSRLREISQELSTLSPSFMNNATKSSEAFEMIVDNEADLSGLPDSQIKAAAHAAAEKGHEGKYRFTLDYPSFGPFLQFADNRDLREKIWHANCMKAYQDEWDNTDNILKIVQLKHERANLLGYKTHAAYVLEERMAKTPDTVMTFLEKMKTAYTAAAEKDFADLKDFADIDDLKPWDVGYYAEKLKQEKFQFSSEDFRPYLQLDRVLSGCFEHFTKLFGLTFKANSDYPTWHKDVKAFDLHDANNNFIGTLYGDFHPREGKKQGAWKTSYRSQGLYKGKIERPVIAIVCNFTKPTPDRPSLLTHGEVTTLFHEMGHAIHALLSDVTYRSLSGTSVLWDFVELPSQVQENWCFEKETLDLFAEHYETGEKIPAELIEKLRAAKNYMGGWAGLRQTSLGTLDMKWHTTDPATIKDVADFEHDVTKDMNFFDRYPGPMSTSFAHIFSGGYSAGYYSYKWAEVLDADTFEAFLEAGLYDQKTADAYKAEILEKGGSDHPSTLYKNFRGRDADPDALLRREGLIEKAA